MQLHLPCENPKILFENSKKNKSIEMSDQISNRFSKACQSWNEPIIYSIEILNKESFIQISSHTHLFRSIYNTNLYNNVSIIIPVSDKSSSDLRRSNIYVPNTPYISNLQ